MSNSGAPTPHESRHEMPKDNPSNRKASLIPPNEFRDREPSVSILESRPIIQERRSPENLTITMTSQPNQAKVYNDTVKSKPASITFSPEVKSKVEMKHVGVGDLEAALNICDAEVQVDDPSNSEIKELTQRIAILIAENERSSASYHLQLQDLQRNLERKVKRAETDIFKLKLDYDEKLSASRSQVQSLEFSLSQLSHELEKTRIERDAILEQNLLTQEEDMSALKEKMVETQALADSLEMHLTSLAEDHCALKVVFDQESQSKSDLQKSLDDALARLLASETEKGRLTLTVEETNESWEKTKIRMGDLHHQLVITKEENEKMEDELYQTRSELKMRDYKIKELQLMVDTMLKYPDVSLGQLPSEPEFINCNNMRITLLEQKNNEYRYMRLKNVKVPDSQNGQALLNAPVVKLWDNDPVQRSAKIMDIRGSNNQTEASPNSQNAVVRNSASPQGPERWATSVFSSIANPVLGIKQKSGVTAPRTKTPLESQIHPENAFPKAPAPGRSVHRTTSKYQQSDEISR
ncbi:hypothetical protein BC829DRAFT_441185 [Chytridium lagenaria]|nr:hypothetical protein BC829DRAFT_441185 [Chytridium lagenaria]